MYQFTKEEREIFEPLEVPMAIYEYIDDKVITLLVSDGFCEMKGIAREELEQKLTDSMFEMVHPNDAGRISS